MHSSTTSTAAGGPVAPPGTDRVNETRIDSRLPLESFVPARLLDTRIGDAVQDGRRRVRRRWPPDAGGDVELDVAGRGGVADDATRRDLNIGVILPSNTGLPHRLPVR